MTPTDVGDLVDAWRKREERKDLRAGVVIATLVRMHTGGKAAVDPWDFFPGITQPPPPTDEELERKIRAVMLG